MGGPTSPSWAEMGRGIISTDGPALPRDGTRCAMKLLRPLGLLCVVLGTCWEPSEAARCSEKQYEHRDKCCNRCPPGMKLLSECNNTSESFCGACESDHYQQSWTKERHCTPHDVCEDNAGLEVKRNGDATHNTLCQCRAGMHCSDASCQSCVENLPCERGAGFVAAKAEARTTSPCEPCPEGTFSNVSSKTEPCHPWTSCEEKGLVMKAKGTNTSDVLCESNRRSSLSVLIPISAAITTCLVGICLCCLVHRDPKQPVQEQLESVKDTEASERQHPVEDLEVLPVQETLLGGQPVAQEDGKESRMAEQEGL